nr:MAG TPA: hypothetical protein [Caudoviricetes sp.]
MKHASLRFFLNLTRLRFNLSKTLSLFSAFLL